MAGDDLSGVEERSPHVIASFHPFLCLSLLNIKFYLDTEWQKPTAYVFSSRRPLHRATLSLSHFHDSATVNFRDRSKKKVKKKIVRCICSSGNTQIYVEYYAHIRLLYVQANFFFILISKPFYGICIYNFPTFYCISLQIFFK